MMKVVKVFKVELHLSNEDREYLLRLFEENRKLVEVIYNVMRHYGYREISCEGVTSRHCPTRIRRLIKSCIRGRGVFTEWKGGLVDLQIDKVWESFVGTYVAHRKMPSEKMIDSLANVVRVRVSKVARSGRFYKRMITLVEYNDCIIAEINVGRREVTAILGTKRDLKSIMDAVNGKGLLLGDPVELVRYGDRIFLHLSLIKNIKLPVAHERVVGVNIGFREHFLVAVAYDLRRNEVVGVLKIPSRELRRLWDLQDTIQRRRTKAFRKVRGRIGNEYYRAIRDYKKRLLKLVKRGRLNYDDLLLIRPVRWLLPFKHNPKRALKVREGRAEYKIAPRDRLGRSVWRWGARYFVYSCVNRVVDFAERYGCTLIVCKNLRGLRQWVSQLKQESRRLGTLYNKTRDYGALIRKRGIDRVVKVLARFPYRVFLDDLRTEAVWHGIAVKSVGPSGTSTTCPKCLYNDRKNVTKEGLFVCQKCGYKDRADFVASINIAMKPFWK